MAPIAVPFTLSIPDEAITDLRTRLGMTRFPDQAPDAPWAYGTDLGYMRTLVAYWKDRFDWRAQEAALNAFPQFGADGGCRCAFPARGGEGAVADAAAADARLAGVGIRVR